MDKETEVAIRQQVYRTITGLYVTLTDDFDELTLWEFEVILLEEIARGLKLSETGLPVIPNR